MTAHDCKTLQPESCFRCELNLDEIDWYHTFDDSLCTDGNVRRDASSLWWCSDRREVDMGRGLDDA